MDKINVSLVDESDNFDLSELKTEEFQKIFHTGLEEAFKTIFKPIDEKSFKIIHYLYKKHKIKL